MRISDWSSDVCSSDLVLTILAADKAKAFGIVEPLYRASLTIRHELAPKTMCERTGENATVRLGCCIASGESEDRKSVVEGKSVSVSVDHGGRRIIKKKRQDGLRNI